MTRNLYPEYTRPLVRGFENKKFLNRSKVILAFLKETALRRVRWAQDPHWIYINPKNRRKPKGWEPKIYICVMPKDFWSVVSELILLSPTSNLNWKFCKNFKLFARPDKIVIYGKNLADLKKTLRLVRPLLKGKRFHKLYCASSTVQSGLEKSGKGIFAGADPLFLKKVSWRYYRWVMGEAVIKENLKNGPLDKNTKKAFEKLNLSLKHQGPNSLKPNKKNILFIKKIWKEILD